MLDRLVAGLGELDAARLAAAARVDLGLDDAQRRAEVMKRATDVVDGVAGRAVRHRDAEVPEQPFGLELVDVHRGRAYAPEARTQESPLP